MRVLVHKRLLLRGGGPKFCTFNISCPRERVWTAPDTSQHSVLMKIDQGDYYND